MNARYTYLLAMMSVSSLALSQDVYNNSAIFIPNSITISMDDFRNAGFLQNNGTMEVNGDWNNWEIYQGLGTVILSGGSQDIDNNDQAIQNLLIAGGGTKSVDGKLSINGSIEFASGIVRVKKEDTLLIRNSATVEGGSPSSFVEGRLTIEGTGYKFFPVGRNNSYYPVTMIQVAGVNPIIEVAAYEDLPRIETSRDIDVDSKKFWIQRLVAGSYDGSPVLVSHNFDLEFRDKIGFVVGDDIETEFDVIENSGMESDGVALSKDPIKQRIIAIGKISAEPITPAYLSTTLSPHAQNPDNRLIRLFGTEMSELNFSFQVFNRWGNMMFESKSLPAMNTDGWDGKYNGQLLPAGAYPYFLGYVDQEGREGRKTGFITIIY